jgi:hypothetical protein
LIANNRIIKAPKVKNAGEQPTRFNEVAEEYTAKTLALQGIASHQGSAPGVL